MAFITLNSDKLKANHQFLNKLFKERGIEWSVVTKLMCGNRQFLKELLKLDISQISDSRISNMKTVKAIKPNVETIYIKPPAKKAIPGVVKYADISMNTEISTIKLLSEEAVKQNVKHKIIIMLEMGELREGVLHENFISFYEKVFSLENIEVVGIGTNLSCMYGVLPSHDKLIQLSIYKQLIEAKFNKKIKYLSGGSSVTIPLIFQGLLPKGINHFRVGETLYLGTDVYNDSVIEGMEVDLFQFYAQIIELKQKPGIPIGEMGTNLEGDPFEPESDMSSDISCRAILDVGLLDVDKNHITPKDTSIRVVGVSSDVTVVDLGENKSNYKTGDFIEFKMDYTAILKILNSKYIDKVIKRN
ncbi:MAG: alanine racemase [Bacteroidales bacterium]